MVTHVGDAGFAFDFGSSGGLEGGCAGRWMELMV